MASNHRTSTMWFQNSMVSYYEPRTASMVIQNTQMDLIDDNAYIIVT